MHTHKVHLVKKMDLL